MKEDEILEFSFRSIRRKPVRRSASGCPHCGETIVAESGKTYICGYSSSASGVTPCVNVAEVKEDSLITELKDQFKKSVKGFNKGLKDQFKKDQYE
jgi:ribosomal protein S27AE